MVRRARAYGGCSLQPLVTAVQGVGAVRRVSEVEAVRWFVDGQLFWYSPEHGEALDLTSVRTSEEFRVAGVSRKHRPAIVKEVTIEHLRILHPCDGRTGSGRRRVHRGGRSVGASPVSGAVASIAVGLVGVAAVHVTRAHFGALVVGRAATAAGEDRQQGKSDNSQREDHAGDAGCNRVLVPSSNFLTLEDSFVERHGTLPPRRFWRLLCRRWRRG